MLNLRTSCNNQYCYLTEFIQLYAEFGNLDHNPTWVIVNMIFSALEFSEVSLMEEVAWFCSLPISSEIAAVIYELNMAG